MMEDYGDYANGIGAAAAEEEEVELTVPRGGPLYVENLTGTLTSVPLFQSSILHELQDLEVELASASSQQLGEEEEEEEDISVDELRILSEEELVAMAIKEVLKEDEYVPKLSPVTEEPSIEKIAEGPEISEGRTCNKKSSKRMKDEEERSELSSVPEEPSIERREGNPTTSILKQYITYSRKRRRILTDKEGALNVLPISEEPTTGRTADDHQKSIMRSCNRIEAKENHLSIKEAEDAPDLLSVPEEPSSERRANHPEMACPEVSKRKSRKRKNIKANSHAHEKNDTDKKALWSQIAKKIDYIKKLKEKQDGDKAAVTLHSFNNLKSKGSASASSVTVERMKPLRSASSAVKVKLSSIQSRTPVHYPEVVLSVEVYHNVRTWVKTQEFLVLGRQTLTEFRDKIYCLTDKVMERDGQHNRSGFFLIEDTFYNNLRDTSAINYSEPIFDWLRKSNDDALKKWECILAGRMEKKKKAVVGDITGSKLPLFQAADMHKTQFCNLKFRLGAGYLYCHQVLFDCFWSILVKLISMSQCPSPGWGDCRHTVVIRDMRLLHPEDIQNREAYPIVLFQLKLHVQKCRVCRIYRATKMSVNDKWAPDNPCYFCDNCYFLLHYTQDGSLQYEDFEVHDYHHDQ